MVKKKFSYYIIIFSLFGLMYLNGACSSKSNITEIKVAISGDFFPFIYTEKDVLHGLEIELLNHLEKVLKIPVIITKYNFSEKLEKLQNEEYDIALGGVTITEYRSEIFDFSKPYYDATQTILATLDSSIVIDSLDNIANYRIGVLNNSTSLLFLEHNFLQERKMSVDNIKKFQSLQDMFLALENNDISLMLLENSIAKLTKYKILYKHDLIEHYAIVFKKSADTVGSAFSRYDTGTSSGRLSLIKKHVNKALEKILESSEWEHLKRKSFII